jgi:membrane-bound serine protease (ClpP class)
MLVASILLALTGLILIYLEFFLPGGIVGVAGGLLLFISAFLFIQFKPPLFLVVTFFFFIAFLLYLVIKFALFQVKRSKHKQTYFADDTQQGYQALRYEKELIGKKAKAATDLKPAGRIFLENKHFQAISRGEYIDKGEDVRIIGGEGGWLIVKKNTL